MNRHHPLSPRAACQQASSIVDVPPTSGIFFFFFTTTATIKQPIHVHGRGTNVQQPWESEPRY